MDTVIDGLEDETDETLVKMCEEKAKALDERLKQIYFAADKNPELFANNFNLDEEIENLIVAFKGVPRLLKQEPGSRHFIIDGLKRDLLEAKQLLDASQDFLKKSNSAAVHAAQINQALKTPSKETIQTSGKRKKFFEKVKGFISKAKQKKSKS